MTNAKASAIILKLFSAKEPLAQSAEHLTFNQRVWSSNLQWLTREHRRKRFLLAAAFVIGKELSITEKSERSRENYLRSRFLKLGIKGLMPRDAVELILGYALSGNDVYTAANALFERFGSAQKILNASYGELCAVEGMTPNAAALICLLSGLYAAGGAIRDEKLRLTDSYAACEYFIRSFRGADVELFKVCCLNGDFSVAECFTVGSGSTYGVNVDIGEMVAKAESSGCGMCIAAHIHPGGSCRPSATDIASTKKLEDAFREAGILLLDHIVVGRDGAQSIFDVGPLGASPVPAKIY